jgi:RNA polymerase sigma factor (sigma-70 family)
MTETPTHLDLTSLSDAHLVELLRGGDERAYAALWSRHYPAARKAARAVTSSHDPEDLAQEAFTRIFAAIKNGKGPTDNFRAYLYATLRSVSMAWSAKLEPTVDLSTQENLLITDSDIASLTEDKRLTLSAFRNLPEDWRTVLWYSEIEGMTPAEIAPIMGLNPRAVSALAFRAREGLRDSWLQAHIPTTSQANSEECQWTEQHIASYARGSITTRRRPASKTTSSVAMTARCSSPSCRVSASPCVGSCCHSCWASALPCSVRSYRLQQRARWALQPLPDRLAGPATGLPQTRERYSP